MPLLISTEANYRVDLSHLHLLISLCPQRKAKLHLQLCSCREQLGVLILSQNDVHFLFRCHSEKPVGKDTIDIRADETNYLHYQCPWIFPQASAAPTFADIVLLWNNEACMDGCIFPLSTSSPWHLGISIWLSVYMLVGCFKMRLLLHN